VLVVNSYKFIHQDIDLEMVGLEGVLNVNVNVDINANVPISQEGER